jgi:hypothetical protein
MTHLSSTPLPPLIDVGNGYQTLDTEIIDYELWQLWTPQAGFTLRGPQPDNLAPGTYCASLGAAFTFGRFAPVPYPALLGKALNLPSLNLGFAGAGPSFYNYPQHQPLIDLVNQAKFVTILVFSGRSQANSRFKTPVYSQEQYILGDGRVVPADFAYQQLLDTEPPDTIAQLVDETRTRYLAAFHELLDKITVPKVLLWFSKRQPAYQESYTSLFKLFSSFPQLVNQPMVNALKARCQAYVEYCDTPGLPQPLISRHTGQPTTITRQRDYPQGKITLTASQLTHNRYYPSPEMHSAVAQQLVTVCRQFV